jgi:hypothetical protein
MLWRSSEGRSDAPSYMDRNPSDRPKNCGDEQIVRYKPDDQARHYRGACAKRVGFAAHKTTSMLPFSLYQGREVE